MTIVLTLIALLSVANLAILLHVAVKLNRLYKNFNELKKYY